MNPSTGQLFDLQEHCATLSSALAALSRSDPATFVQDEETLEYGLASDWLELAAGVCKVEILTGRYDDSLMYCSTARAFEDARSDLLTRLATELSIFSFSWGAFETVAKMVDPPSIPADQRSNGANGLIDRVIFLLRDSSPLAAYRSVLCSLDAWLSARHPPFSALFRRSPLPLHMGESGVGLDFVRRVRNRFAHGAASLPLPDDCTHGWCGKLSTEPDVIRVSTRIVLFTLQMLLSAFYQGRNFELYGVLEDEEGFSAAFDVHLILTTLHVSSAEEVDSDEPT